MNESTRGVLFDVDGTLVDTNYLHTVTWWEALRQAGHRVPMARIHRAIGMGSDKLLDHLLGPDHDRSADSTMRDAHLALYTTYWERLSPLPGAAALLRACASRGLRVALASSASEKELSALRRALDADAVIHTATSKDDAGSSKPDPDILTVALRKAGLSPDHALLVGDSVWDVVAADRAGLRCIGVTCGGTSAAELRDAGAIETYDDPEALCASLDASAIAKMAG
ncbi:HAD family hydrolase [Planosporangium thailandense]|uniref:HAD family hydrolase n=1 Tax=Planosporangium thailandense TaxID=765197 RepID=A0ABX0XWN0_9ACTN|nr:HAD family hydrolase [Planosporangium thailandense]NJC70312.1 HAD family hydrolase [Planosporangium thailandense]